MNVLQGLKIYDENTPVVLLKPLSFGPSLIKNQKNNPSFFITTNCI